MDCRENFRENVFSVLGGTVGGGRGSVDDTGAVIWRCRGMYCGGLAG